ncbi:hypothetical protein GCM10025783_08480 [Amnibacterium soli]|uniref:Uncharacterized protein n=1 Tax=Amnibacterium soli TaxID=1282736 RepID=A0ABP8YUC5_9MICO
MRGAGPGRSQYLSQNLGLGSLQQPQQWDSALRLGADRFDVALELAEAAGGVARDLPRSRAVSGRFAGVDGLAGRSTESFRLTGQALSRHPENAHPSAIRVVQLAEAVGVGGG